MIRDFLMVLIAAFFGGWFGAMAQRALRNHRLPCCHTCGAFDDLTETGDRMLCDACLDELYASGDVDDDDL